MDFIILLLGTPYMDKRYSNLITALAARKHLRNLYPEISIQIVSVFDNFEIADEIFWADHKEELEAINKRKGEEKRKHLTIV